MTAKMAIVKALIENEIVELLLKSRIDNIYLTDGVTTLAAKLSEMVTAINDRAKISDVTSQINTAIDNLINGAPETYNTLKEISDYLSTHENEYTALIASVAAKVDKVEGKGLSTNDFTDAFKAAVEGLGALASKSIISESDLDESLKAKVNAAAEGNHSHSNKAALDTVTAAKILAWDAKPNTYIQTSQPASLKAGDIFLHIVE